MPPQDAETGERIDGGADGRLTERYERKRELILDAAARLFHQHGLDGVTLADIAARVGLATNSVTYYFRRKDVLVAACFARAFAAFDVLIDDATRSSQVDERVRVLLRGYFQLLADIADGARSEIVSPVNVSVVRGPAAEPTSAAYTALFRKVRALLDDGDRTGDARIRLNCWTHLLLAISQWGRVWLPRYETDGYVRAADRVTDIFLYGLLPGDQPRRAAPATGASAEAPEAKRSGGGARRRHVATAALTAANDPFLSRELFLRAATRLFSAHGIHGASVERISASLNATKGAFYHHNADKHELIGACFDRSFAIIRNALDAAQQREAGRDRLEEAVAALVRFQLSDAGPLLRITSLVGLPPAEAAGVVTTVNRLSERFAGFVIDGVIDGSLRPVDPTAAAQALQATISAAASAPRWISGINQDNAVTLLVTPLMHGFCAGQSRPRSPDAATDAEDKPQADARRRPARSIRNAGN